MTASTRPPGGGYFYAVVRRPKPDGTGSEFRPLRGPYVSHDAARAALAAARLQAIKLDPMAMEYEFGTARCENYQGPGIFDALDKRSVDGAVNPA